MTAYKRVLLKLSGESLMGAQQYGIDPNRLADYASDIKEACAMGVQIGIVIGGGNIFRGVSGAAKGFDRVKGDQMGMLATVINSLALSSALEGVGVKTKVLTAVRMEPVGTYYSPSRAAELLRDGHVVLMAGGTGNPFFTTDTAAALRGAEMNCDVMLKATNVDGVYTADPKKDPSATRYETITFDEALNKNLKVMDATAFALCRERKLNIVVFGIAKQGSLKRVITGEDEGTLVHC